MELLNNDREYNDVKIAGGRSDLWAGRDCVFIDNG